MFWHSLLHMRRRTSAGSGPLIMLPMPQVAVSMQQGSVVVRAQAQAPVHVSAVLPVASAFAQSDQPTGFAVKVWPVHSRIIVSLTCNAPV
jgi:hypothetical protein